MGSFPLLLASSSHILHAQAPTQRPAANALSRSTRQVGPRGSSCSSTSTTLARHGERDERVVVMVTGETDHATARSQCSGSRSMYVRTWIDTFRASKLHRDAIDQTLLLFPLRATDWG